MSDETEPTMAAIVGSGNVENGDYMSALSAEDRQRLLLFEMAMIEFDNRLKEMNDQELQALFDRLLENHQPNDPKVLVVEAEQASRQAVDINTGGIFHHPV